MSLSSGLAKLNGLHPQVRAHALWTIAVGELYGLRPVVTSGFRSVAKQRELYERFLAGRSRYPVARPGNSAHNFGLAWDSDVPDERMADWTAIRRWAGWHVPENDEVHAAVPDWRRYVIL